MAYYGGKPSFIMVAKGQMRQFTEILKAAGARPISAPSRTSDKQKLAPGNALSNMIPNTMKVNGAAANEKKRVMNHSTLEGLVKSDPITWGLMKMTRFLVNQVPWSITPDVAAIEDEMDRYYDWAADQIYEWSYKYDFKSNMIPAGIQLSADIAIKEILTDSDTTVTEQQKRFRLETLFRTLKRELEQQAMLQVSTVNRLFTRPNNQLEKSLRALQELVMNDILLDDAGVIVKNFDSNGDIAELWRPPGWQIIPILYPDFTVPQPPDPAYIWYDGSKVRAWFTNDELTYIMQNPQGNGYGMSPCESLIMVISATLLGDTAFIRNLREGFQAPFLINLKEANEVQRSQFESLLDAQMSKSAGNKGIVLSNVPSEDGTFQYQELNRGHDFARMQAAEYLKMAPGIKAFAFGYQSADIGLINDAAKGAPISSDALTQLSNRRAVVGILSLLSEYYNAEIVRQVRGASMVKFEFQADRALTVDPYIRAKADSVDIASGIYSRNEVRRKRGDRPVSGGNIYTVATGNAIIQLDALEFAGQDEPEADEDIDGQGDGTAPGAGGANPGAVITPTVSAGGAAKKRNNANKRQQTNGTEPRS